MQTKMVGILNKINVLNKMIAEGTKKNMKSYFVRKWIVETGVM